MDERYLNEALWHVCLSDGRKVSDDGGDSWRRLREFCQHEKLWIVDFWLSFRDHIERPLPRDAAGYFFRRAVLGSPGDPVTRGLFVVGFLEDNIVRCQIWDVPELRFAWHDKRGPSDPIVIGEDLISRGSQT